MPTNSVCISPTGIVLGKSVTDFFLKRKVDTVSIILDYKNKALILWGDNPAIIKPEDSIRNGRAGFKIYYVGAIYDRKTQAIREYTFVRTKLGGYIGLQNRAYIAKPLNKFAVIIEDMIMADVFTDNRKFFFNTKGNFIVMGNMSLAPSIKPEGLIRQTQKNVPADVKNTPTNQPIPTSASMSNKKIEDNESISTIKADNEYKHMILGENE
jgi:hypothetical protein